MICAPGADAPIKCNKRPSDVAGDAVGLPSQWRSPSRIARDRNLALDLPGCGIPLRTLDLLLIRYLKTEPGSAEAQRYAARLRKLSTPSLN